MAIALPVRTRATSTASVRFTELRGRRVALVDIERTQRAGALSGRDGETLAHAFDLALATRVPIVVVLATAGADVGDGMPALHGWGLAARALVACSGIVPIVMIANGPVVSGPALLLGVADVVITTPEARLWVSGPNMVTSMTGVEVDGATLGGSAVHESRTGVAALRADDTDGALELAAELLSMLPSHTDEAAPLVPTGDDPARPTPELRDVIPAAATGSYDVRDVIGAVVDDGWLLELRERWAPNLVTAIASIAGRPVGIVANQPSALAGTLDIPASQKGAGFVQFCDAFNLPLVTMVDTPGFFPGKDLEWRGMIRHGAQLVFAYAQATVPRICLILRKAYGGAYIVMDCRSMGNDVCLAWPSAEVAVMGAKGAVSVLHRDIDDDERARLETAYEDAYLNPYIAGERGLIDAVIDPAETRRLLSRSVAMLETKRERLVPRAHANTPL